VAHISCSSEVREKDGRDGESAAGEVLDRCKEAGRASCTTGRDGVDGNSENAGLLVG